MKIGAAALRRESDRTAVEARVEWEESALPPLEITFTVEGTGAEALREDSHPFLLSAVVPAWRRREKRIAVDGAVCPRLRDGIEAAQRLLARWWDVPGPPARLEASRGWSPSSERPDRAAVFLTGGVDSLHLLWSNRRAFPADHPAAFRDAITSRRMSFVENAPSPRAIDLARRQARAVAAIAAASGLDLLEVDSNFRLVDPTPRLPGRQDQGALLAALAHLLSARVGSASIAATFSARALHPWGTHPLLDPLYSSSGVAIRHEGIAVSRSEKLASLAGWDVARRNLMVCFEGPLPEGEINCGRCEKCLRTMTALVALGVLDRFEVFGGRRPTGEAIEAMTFGYSPQHFEFSWAPILAILEERGERELAGAVRRKIAASRAIERWHRNAGWKGTVRRLDRRWLGGSLVKLSRALRGIPTPAR